MKLPEAKDTFQQLMAISRSRKLTPGERKSLKHASQVIRYSRRTTAKNSKRVTIAKKKSNPRAVLIYKSITRVEGTKGPDSMYPGEKFFHNFKRPYPKMYGLPDGSLLIKK